MKLNLYSKRWGKNSKAELDLILDDEKITFEGYDIGDSVEEAWGDSDYEFWRYYKKDQFDKMLMHLIKECFDQKIFETESQFAKWCDQKGIENSFQSWA
ncbi:MAG: hypothetical protein ACXAE3_13660 [Candidatus Kariarchaeaceae archaeon]